MRTFRGINWKELILDHGEKLVFGMVLVFVLGGVATTRWSTYDRTPEEFQDRITQGKSAFNASHWPLEKRLLTHTFW